MNQLSPIMGESAIGKELQQEEVRDFLQQSYKKTKQVPGRWDTWTDLVQDAELDVQT